VFPAEDALNPMGKLSLGLSPRFDGGDSPFETVLPEDFFGSFGLPWTFFRSWLRFHPALPLRLFLSFFSNLLPLLTEGIWFILSPFFFPFFFFFFGVRLSSFSGLVITIGTPRVFPRLLSTHRDPLFPFYRCGFFRVLAIHSLFSFFFWLVRR